MTSAYGKSHPAKRHSAALTDGVDRAPARAMLKGVGFTDADLARPLIGVATTWIETMPCNLNQRLLAGYVKQGIRAAGGTPMEFNTIAVSDGVTMGTVGMRASLVSREVIADSIELVARGHLFDGIVCIVGCDKTIPAAVMALARLDLPGLVFYGGSIAAGRYRGKDVTIQDVFEAVGSHAAGSMTDNEVHALESVACPGAGACGGHFTANTMATALDFLGVSAPGLNEVPATHPGKPHAAVAAGELAMKLVESDTRPSSVLTREAFENAITAIAATGGSTNGVLHLLAIAKEVGVELSIDDFDAISARTPIVADIKPGGRYVATDLFAAGGTALVARELVRARRQRRSDGSRRTDASPGRGRRARAPRPGRGRLMGQPAQPHRRSCDPARQPRARGLRREARRPRAPAPQRAGEGLRLRGGLLRGGQGAHDRARRRRRDPLRGARRRPRDAGDAPCHGVTRR
jgi:dihydroxy-acid dehydratase